MATFDQLSAEQRAIIELVLKQGRSYDQLADMLGLPASRVRELAREALVRLSPVSAAAVEDDWRGKLGDYLLNQQDGPEATTTRGHLRRSEAARGWARSVLDSLEQFYDPKDLPTIPAGDAGAEAGTGRKRREPREKREPRKKREPREKRGPGKERDKREPPEKRDEEPAEPARELSPAARGVVLRRRLLGLGGVAALVLLIAVLFWPIGVLLRDDEESAGAGDTTTGAGVCQGGDESAGDTTTGASEQARLVGQLPLAPVEGAEGAAQAQGLAVIAERVGQCQVILRARLPRNARDEAYEVWLYNSQEDAVSLGAQVADRQGNFQGAAPLPDDFEDYESIEISREPIRGPETHSGDSLLRGAVADFAAVPDQAEGELPGGGQGDAPAPAP